MPSTKRCSPEIPNIFCIYKYAQRMSILAFPPIFRLLAVGLFVLAFAGLFMGCKGDPIHPTGANAYQMVTGDDTEDDRHRWDSLFNTQAYVYGKEPAAFLQEHIHLLPVGRALDIAMGEGRNAVYLAKKGFSVDGVDFSEVALRKAKRLARENQVSINALYADLNSYSVKPEFYDIIVNIDYLNRGFVSQIKRGLKKGGLIVYECHTLEQLKNVTGLKHDFLLRNGELKELFKDYQILVYRETNDGKDARASLIARKP